MFPKVVVESCCTRNSIEMRIDKFVRCENFSPAR